MASKRDPMVDPQAGDVVGDRTVDHLTEQFGGTVYYTRSNDPELRACQVSTWRSWCKYYAGNVRSVTDKRLTNSHAGRASHKAAEYKGLPSRKSGVENRDSPPNASTILEETRAQRCCMSQDEFLEYLDRHPDDTTLAVVTQGSFQVRQLPAMNWEQALEVLDSAKEEHGAD